jgi:glutamate racemase
VLKLYSRDKESGTPFTWNLLKCYNLNSFLRRVTLLSSAQAIYDYYYTHCALDRGSELSDKNDYPLGIFDSGLGGLTVLKELCSMLPDENIVYLGDTARVPYGIRSPATVTRYSFECIKFLLQKEIKILVIACNTVSSISLPEIKKTLEIPVVGVIEPGARAAAEATKNKKIGVIGTEATIKSKAYSKAIGYISKEIEVYEHACPLFVPLAEEGWTEDIIAFLIADKYLTSIKEKGVDTLVLGCTHYPLLKNVIQKAMGDAALIDSAVETSKVVRDVLLKNGLERQSTLPPKRKYYVTDSPEKFRTLGEKFLHSSIDDIEKIAL